MNGKAHISNSKYNKKSTIYVYLTLILFVLMMAGCQKEPIKIGFIGDMSNKNSQLSVDARNAIEYGIALLNESGGIDGREIILVVKDEQSSLEIAKEKHQEFIDEDVHFVIGHMNSNMAPAMIESASEELLFISPSMSTTELSGLDDFILRTSPINKNQAKLFVDYAIKLKLQDIVVVYDLMNEEYTKTVADEIINLYEQEGMYLPKLVPYDTRTDNLGDVANIIIKQKPKNVYIIAQATDTAYLIQSIKRDYPEIGFYSVSWSMTKDLVLNGGQYVEDTKFVGIYFSEEDSKEYLDFVEGFKNDYSYEPSFVCILAYDSLMTLVKGIEETEKIDPVNVKKKIIEIGTFNGLRESFSVDKYGDNDRNYMLYKLTKGEFIPLRDW